MSELMPLMSSWIVAWAVAPGALAIGWLSSARTPRAEPLAEPEPEFELGRTKLAAERVEVAVAVQTVLRRLDAQRARLLARVRVAVRDDLLVHADPRALRQALDTMVRVGLNLSPAADLLISARRHGRRIEISVLADGPPDSETALRAALRDVEAIVALHGGSIEVDPRLDGAVLRMRLPEYIASPAPARPSGDTARGTALIVDAAPVNAAPAKATPRPVCATVEEGVLR